MELSDAITICLIEDIDDITQTQWNKLLFFTDGAGACKDRQFTDFTYIKLPYGPVPNNYSELINSMHYRGIIQIENSPDNKISLRKSDDHIPNLENAKNVIGDTRDLKTIVEKIVKIFKDWSAVKLSSLSHELDAWKNPSMYAEIDLKDLKNDTFLKERFGEANFRKLLFR